MITVAVQLLEYIPGLRLSPLENHRSKIFKITSVETRWMDGLQAAEDWSYSDDELRSHTSHDPRAEVTVGLVNHQLEDNWYLRPLSDRFAALSVCIPHAILKAEDIEIDTFVIKNIYEICLVVAAYRGISDQGFELVHDDTRGCLYDMNGDMGHIAHSTIKPIVCATCKTHLRKAGLPDADLQQAEQELKRLNRTAFNRIRRFVKAHPYLAIGASSLGAVLVGLITSFIYDWLRPMLFSAK